MLPNFLLDQEGEELCSIGPRLQDGSRWSSAGLCHSMWEASLVCGGLGAIDEAHFKIPFPV